MMKKDINVVNLEQLSSIEEKDYDKVKGVYLCRKELIKIPLKIGLFNCLEVLDLRCNKIVGVPKVILKLPKLRELYLADNKINEILDDFKYLINLEELDIRYNPLKRINNGFIMLNKLKRLKICYNKLMLLYNESIESSLQSCLRVNILSYDQHNKIPFN